LCRVVGVPNDEELTFADHTGRFYARRYGMAPMVGRLLGYLAVCDPHEQSITELADALLASRSAIAGAVNTLETLRLIQRSRAAGERMDRVRIDMSGPNAMGFDISEYREQGELAREGLRLLADAPPNGERSYWSGPRSPISWWSGFPCWSRSGRNGERRSKPPASSLRPRVPIEGQSAMTGRTSAPGIVARTCASRSAAIWCSTRST